MFRRLTFWITSRRRAMGNMTLAREHAREAWVSTTIERVWRDAVYAVRALRREPTFAVTALLTLSLGATATITVFTIVDAELWKPLPFAHARQLVGVAWERPGTKYDAISGADLVEWRAQSRLVDYAGAQRVAARVLRGETPERVSVWPVTADFFPVLGVSPAVGRAFRDGDVRDAAVILSDAGWHRLFDGDPAVVGRRVALDDQIYAIVGVMAGVRLEFTSDPDFFTLLDQTQPSFLDRQAPTLDVYGRMRAGVHLPQAQSELRAIAARIASEHPAGHTDHVARLYDLQAEFLGFNWRELYFFLAAAAAVMLLACLNVASLLLSRALRRQREFAIRGALGGGRAALVRQLVVEGAVLAMPAAAAGVLLSVWTVHAFAAGMPSDLLVRTAHVAPDLRAVVFAAVLSLTSASALALSPFMFARRLDLNPMLGHSARIAGRAPRQRALRTTLLVAQVTTTVVLLTAAALFMLSFVKLSQTPVGFELANRVALQVTLPVARYAEDPAVAGYATRLLDAARAVAGVQDAAVASSAPLDSSAPAVRVLPADRARPAPGSEPLTLFFSASPTYFRTLRIPLVAGRFFSDADLAGAPRVAIVNARLARLAFPGENAVGHVLEVIPRAQTGWTHRPGQVTIVGVVADVKNFSIDEADFNNLYLPFAQAPSPGVQLVVSTSVPVGAIAAPLRRAAAAVDPNVPVRSLKSLGDKLRASLAGARFNLTLIVLLAGLALAVASVGIYGSVACAIQERAREFGVRMALGASARSIFGDALRESARVAALGAVLGTLAIVVLAQLLGSALYLVQGQHGGLLYRVSMTSPAAVGIACVLVVAAALVAGVAPARRATRVDPLIVLRTE